MSPTDFKEKYLNGFDKLSYIFSEDRGFIVWRRGTGGNVEILHLRVFRFREGIATDLFNEMVRRLEKHPPYHSIFVFLLADNEPAKAAYESFGFTLTKVEGLYAGGEAYLGTLRYNNIQHAEAPR